MATSDPEAFDRRPPLDIRTSAVFSLLAGVASAVPIGRASRRTSRLVAGTSAVAVGASAARLTVEAAAAERAAAGDGPAVPPTARQGVGPVLAGALAAGVTFGTVVASIALDRRLEAFLVRRGVRRPRLAIGFAAGLGSFLIDRLDALLESPPQAR